MATAVVPTLTLDVSTEPPKSTVVDPIDNLITLTPFLLTVFVWLETTRTPFPLLFFPFLKLRYN